ncbi:hypothetical protein [Hungatella hathewayi]|uniref:GOLD domain-containing protein n=1 Tax=Hungatella hathewayi WAL-18680 TaxID=742737 RepID=G5IHA9_9FIRM|nr:hypothetical protein [Hungatella hathewayi]EHI59180.1 hypothetical protein HMPREF9473_02887 [ [Hungatella hathewayi WAL-18680]
MKKLFSILSVMIIIFSLMGCTPDFNGSRTGNENQLIMEFSTLNTTDSQDLVLETGNFIKAKIDISRGNLSVKIQKDKEEPLYVNDVISGSEEFTIKIEKSGTYTVTVTGKKASGSVSFIAEKVTFSESNENKVWTEENIKNKFSARFNQDAHLEIVDYEVISDYAFERVGAVLLKDIDMGTVEVAFMDSEGYFQKMGISAELASEPEFAYIGNGVVSLKLLTVDGTIYTCEVSFSKENDEIKYTVKDIFD